MTALLDLPEPEIFADLEQGTADWLAARAGVVTASECACLLVDGKNHPQGLGAGALTYARKIAGEVFRGGPNPMAFGGNAHTERGHELEPQIRQDYEWITGRKVREVGFIRRGRAGYSPDGLAGPNRILEIKTHTDDKLIAMHIDPGFPVEHMPQVQFGLYVSGFEIADLVAGFPGLPLLIRSTGRDEKIIQKLHERTLALHEYVDEIVERLRELA